MNVGQLYHRYATQIDFIRDFEKTNEILGGIFVANYENPEMIVAKNAESGKLYIFENFSHPRRMKCFLPVSVFEVDDAVLRDSCFKTLVPHTR
jgi:hypothetical protein